MVRWEYRDICDNYAEAKRRADGITYWDGDDLVTASVQPLFRSPQPTLTDEEREAIRWAANTLCVGWDDLKPDDKDTSRIAAGTLREILDRLGDKQ